jgi:hypothetical protein
MQALTRKTAKHMSLPLLVIFVLCAGISDMVFWAESQLLEIEPGIGGERSSSEDGDAIAGFPATSLADRFLPLSRYNIDTLSPDTGSDAYPSNITHGPPARVFTV